MRFPAFAPLSTADACRYDGAPPDGDRKTVHLRCGDDIRDGLAQAGFTGDFVRFAYPFVHGPAFPAEDRDVAIDISARFLASVGFEASEASAREEAAAAFDALDRARGYARICLWFEHDAYDILCLAFLLARFSNAPPAGEVRLICCDGHPSVERFIGVGQLAPDALRGLWADSRPVGEAEFAFGARLWRAFQDADPVPLWRMVSNGTPEIPAVAGAVLRQLRELPDAGSGLSLTEALTLRILRDRGDMPAGRLFRDYTFDYEPLPFMGDLGFRNCVLLPLSGGTVPAIGLSSAGDGNDDDWWRTTTVSLTPTGAALLDGEADWLSLAQVDRWIGGVHVVSGAPGWRWNPDAETPVRARA